MRTTDFLRFAARTAAAMGVSALILFLIFRLTPSPRTETGATAWSALRKAAPALLALYAFCSLAQAWFRARRYRVLILGAGETEAPPFRRLFIVTLTRNMLVDLLPGRLGELSYAAMLNRGYGVGGAACASSLAVSVLFDFVALLFVVAGLLSATLAAAGSPGWMGPTAIVLAVVVALMAWVIFSGARHAAFLWRALARPLPPWRWVGRVSALTDRTVQALHLIRRAAVLWPVLAWSVLIRLTKYAGVMAIFYAVALPSFPNLATASPAQALLALVGAEGGASLPVPAFMSFGSYEGGGLLAFAALGFPPEEAARALLATHIASQFFDYVLGGMALFVFFLTARRVAPAKTTHPRGFVALLVGGILLASLLAGGAIAWRARARKSGTPSPPPQGQEVPMPPPDTQRLHAATKNLRGFIVWSSNRFGTHDILMLTLPDLRLTQLTSDPHTDYFPRISPNGRRIVFSRSQRPWVSQRDYMPWDVYLLDLETRRERLLARDGNTPTWSEDGAWVYFQRHGGRFVAHEVATGQEKTLFEAGEGPIPAGAMLETPSFSQSRQAMAVTLRGRRRGTAVFRLNGSQIPVAGGCQLAWLPTAPGVYWVDKGGRQQNAIYRRDDLASRDKTMWLDLPGEFSHEYFPKPSADGQWMVLGASAGGHEHDSADYEIFLWPVGRPPEEAVRVTFHTGNDCWPDIYLAPSAGSVR